jgi:serine protease
MGTRALVMALAGVACAYLPATAGAAHLTGRYQVVFDHSKTAQSSSALSAVLARTGVTKAGRGVPDLGISTVKGTAAELAALRHDPAVKSVSAEWERDFFAAPNDPSLSIGDDQYPNPGGAPLQWTLARQNFPAAWDITKGDKAIVAVLDTGIDASHPELAGKIHSLDAIDAVSPGTDENGHGTHVSGLACAATNDAIAVAGAGYNCRIAFVKLPLLDEDIIAGVDRAISRGAQAINMSFGGGGPNAALDQAIDRALAAKVVVVAAAKNDPVTDQGSPADQLQPDDGPNIAAGRGLVVTAADFADQNAQTGRGNEISVAAYGFFDPVVGAPGIISTAPAGHADILDGGGLPLLGDPPCGCRRSIGGVDRYAYLQGTSMATPQVTALAAMIGALNPALPASEKIRIIKQTARRSGGWTPELGWGIINAGAAVDAARHADRYLPASKARAKTKVTVARGKRKVKVRVRWSQSDPAGSTGLIASGVSNVDLYLRHGDGRYKRVRAKSRAKTAVLTLGPGTYRLYTRALDRAANREGAPKRADVRIVVKKRR